MAITITWLGHASFKVTGPEIVYIDPWKINGTFHDGDVILVSHGHFDHFSKEDIEKVIKPDGKLVSASDVVKEWGGKNGVILKPGQKQDFQGMQISGVPAYNREKQFHPKANNWLGFVITIEDKLIYYAGDTDQIDEMVPIPKLDCALLPIGGTYTMDAKSAASAAAVLNTDHVIPYHWGDIVGGEGDAVRFQEIYGGKTDILSAGESIEI